MIERHLGHTPLRTKSTRAACTVAVALLALSQLQAQEPAAVSLLKDQTYSRAGGVDLKLDIARPPDTAGKGPFPAVIYFHGGGWQAGKRQDAYSQIRFLASQGIVGITVSYRFAPDFKWPAQVHDAKTAVRYVRTHASGLNIDATRIAAAGDSAGAYLALMLGFTSPADGLEGSGEWADVSSRVQAVVSYYSMADFTRLKPASPSRPLSASEEKQKAELEAITLAYYNKSAAQVLADWSGTMEPEDPIWAKLSPITYVSENDAPVLVIQGDRDPVVSVNQAYLLGHALSAVKVPHEVLIIESGGHGFTRPQSAQAAERMIAFLRRIPAIVP